MTDEEIAKADQEYAALPGTRPNGYSFRSNEQMAQIGQAAAIKEMISVQGGSLHRVTKTDDGLWVEAWDERPHKQAEFDPPYTLTPP